MIQARSVVLFQGDSITDWGRKRDLPQPNDSGSLGGGYCGLIAARLLKDRPGDALQFLNCGISGNRIVDLYARWKVDTLNLKPDVLSILIGVNDAWHEFGSQNGVEVERYAQFYRMLLEWTRRVLPKIQLVLCEPFILPCGVITPVWYPDIAARCEVVCALAAEFKTVFVPFQSGFADATQRAPAEYWSADGVHPTLAGHQLMADVWLRAVGLGDAGS